MNLRKQRRKAWKRHMSQTRRFLRGEPARFLQKSNRQCKLTDQWIYIMTTGERPGGAQ